jgi:cell division transport system permease protein
MTDDGRIDPPPLDPPSFGPRQMRASLSSSLGRPPGAGRSRRGREIYPSPFDDPPDPTPIEVPPPEAGVDPDVPPDPRWEEAAVATAADLVAVPVAPAVPEPDAAPKPASTPVVETVPAPRPPARRGKTARRPAEAKPPARRDERGGASGRAQTIVPPQAVAGRALVSVVAIMCLLAALAIGALSLVAEAARDWQLDVAREATIQVLPIDGKPIEPRLSRALDIARATTGVRSARLVDEKESARLLEPWLGKGLDLSVLPIPRLVVVELADPATADLAGLTARVKAEVAGGSVDDRAVWAGRLRTMAGATVLVGIGVVGLMLAAMVLTVVSATRAAMAGNREVIEVLHFVGAEDRFIARQFQWHFLLLGLKGGAIGGTAAIVVFLLADFATRPGRTDGFADQAQALFGGISVGLSGHLGVVALVAVVAALTALTSRVTVLGHLGRLD